MGKLYSTSAMPICQMTTKTAGAFLAAYYSSNRLFPQSRFYFVLDFCRRLNAAELDSVLARGVTLRAGVLERLADLATASHRERWISKAVSTNMIESDISKMLRALREVYSAFVRDTPPDHRTAKFVSECARIKIAVDALDLSPRYLDFVSSNAGDTNAAAIFRFGNTVLVETWAETMEDSALTRALMVEIDRPIWLRRPV